MIEYPLPVRCLSGPIAFLILVLNCVACGGAQSTVAEQHEYQQAIKKVVESISPSLIRFETIGGLTRVGNQLVNTAPSSGLLIDRDGYAFSAAINFVHRPTASFARVADGTRFPAEIVATDHSRQLVLLKLRTTDQYSFPQPPATIDRDDLRVGKA